MATINKVEEREFWTLYWNNELKIIEGIWKRSNSGKEMTEEEFENYILHLTEVAEKYKAEGLLVNIEEYHIPVPPELQEWHDKVIIPKYQQLGITKVAFVAKQNTLDELVAYISLEQTFEEEKAQAINTQFFQSLEEARSFFQ